LILKFPKPPLIRIIYTVCNDLLMCVREVIQLLYIIVFCTTYLQVSRDVKLSTQVKCPSSMLRVIMQ